MDLNSIAGLCIAAVNPMSVVSWQRSTGYSTSAAGVRMPTYASATNISVQLQGLADHELRQLNGLNIGGILSKVYAHGTLASIIRNLELGGDLLTFGGNTWLVVHVLEQWPDWCSVAIQQQSIASNGTQSGGPGNTTAPYFTVEITPVSVQPVFDSYGVLIPSPLILNVAIHPMNGYRFGAVPISITLPIFDDTTDWVMFSAQVDGSNVPSSASTTPYTKTNTSANFTLELSGNKTGWGVAAWQNVKLSATDGTTSVFSNSFSILPPAP